MIFASTFSISSSFNLCINTSISQGYNSIVLGDLANNFYISANNRDAIFYNADKIVSQDSEDPVETTEQTF